MIVFFLVDYTANIEEQLNIIYVLNMTTMIQSKIIIGNLSHEPSI